MDNGGCRLPCWWGFQPGSTTWESARKLLEPIARVIYSPDPGANPTAYEVLIPTEAEDLWPSPRRQIYDVKDGIIENIEVEIVNLYPYGDFLTMIRTYGKPDEVWVSTGAGNIPPGGKTTDFWTALFYQKQGIIALYEYSSAKIEGKIIKGCPYESFGSNMQLWNPKKRLTFFEAADELQDFPKAEIFLPLHEATGLNVDSFYQIMNDSDVPPCLETPLELWP
jgi:hypothetical protein